ncbi:hypothetical protein L1285_17390 [Pseudoalteromonas sp. DL2-H2.2]|uniref:hypothetical protein n=1 Tax=Pseudoalteromonas sp. DL2-H2.2 TaxID=2908889 RepID=UPI001F1F5F2B|nr:hypothetical protein [Pseudoalteromonas sp. DL2-H2.2]MCF2910091.1 hypothetical protein [Pseudoalteromonas sp. DL2-H2.2]
MALEHDIASLVEASEALASTVDNQIESINNTVSSKMTEVNNFVAQQKARVDSSLDDLTIIGDGERGTLSMGIAHFFTSGYGSTNVHLRLPLNVEVDTEMFHLKVRGYAYHEAKAIDATFVGYAYAHVDNLVQEQATGTHLPTLYVGEDKHVYCRLSFEKKHYAMFSVDAMRVGSGRLLKAGDIRVIESDEEQVSGDDHAG